MCQPTLFIIHRIGPNNREFTSLLFYTVLIIILKTSSIFFSSMWPLLVLEPLLVSQSLLHYPSPSPLASCLLIKSEIVVSKYFKKMLNLWYFINFFSEYWWYEMGSLMIKELPPRKTIRKYGVSTITIWASIFTYLEKHVTPQ